MFLWLFYFFLILLINVYDKIKIINVIVFYKIELIVKVIYICKSVILFEIVFFCIYLKFFFEIFC